VIPRDTTPEIAAMQARIHKSMTGEQCLLFALEITAELGLDSEFKKALQLCGLQ